MVVKNNKRLLSEDESCQISYKHPRHLDCTSFAGFVPCSNLPEVFQTTVDEGGGNLDKYQHEQKSVIPDSSELSVPGEEFDNCTFGCISGLSYVTSRTCEEEARFEPTYPVSCPPRYYDHEHQSRTPIVSEEIFSSLLDYAPQKLVSVGPDHQAEIPTWNSEAASEKSSDCLDSSTPATHNADVEELVSSRDIQDDNWEQFIGTCVIPMSEVDTFEDFGHGRADCSCPDEGSLRCVRQHIKEAREKLFVALGQGRFLELGFSDMGEDVAQKWSEEEEQVFRDVVISNPASLGKNFWDHLAVVFSNKTKKELVSYYFNVFMLRKRAEQNRRDPMNIDSDNDEWLASDDGDECAVTEEDEDSVVESPAEQLQDKEAHEDNYNEAEDKDEDDEDGDGDGNGDNNHENDAGDVDVSEDSVGLHDASELHVTSTKPNRCKLIGNEKFGPADNHAGSDVQNALDEQDALDESCTSYECLQIGAVSYGPSNMAATQEEQVEADIKILDVEYTDRSLNGMVDDRHSLEACETKVWDAGFFTSTADNVDFLPTCSIVEEVSRDDM